MITFILSLHVLIATVTTGSILGVFIAARAQRRTRAYLTMLVSFAATALSGVALLAISAHGLGRFCAMMSAYVVVVAFARHYYHVRTAAFSSL